MQDLPRPGIPLVSPALAGEFFTIEPPSKSCSYHSYRNVLIRENKNLQINGLTRGGKKSFKRNMPARLKKTTPTKEICHRGKKHYGDIYFYICMTINRAMVTSPTQPLWRPVENLTQVGRQNDMSPGDHKFIYSHAFCKL